MSDSILGDNPGTQAPAAGEAAAQPGTGAAGGQGQGEEGQAGQTPSLILGKFKSQTELEKAYQELERTHTKTAQELAGYRRARQAPANQAGQAGRQPAAGRGEVDPDAFLQALVDNPMGTLRAVVGEMVQSHVTPLHQAEQRREFAGQIEAMTRDSENYPGFGELKADIAAMFDQIPQLADVPGGLKLAYWAARGQKVKEIAARAAQQGASQAEKDLMAKLAVGSGGGTGGAQAGPAAEDAAIINSIRSAGKGSGGIFG